MVCTLKKKASSNDPGWAWAMLPGWARYAAANSRLAAMKVSATSRKNVGQHRARTKC